MQYTDDSLSSIENILVQSINHTQDYNNQFINSLSQILNVVSSNRAELHPENSYSDIPVMEEEIPTAEEVPQEAELAAEAAGKGAEEA